MKKYVISISFLICLATVKPSNITAQSFQRIEVQIPFSFVLNGRTLPAGKYVVERTDAARPNVLTIKSVDKRIVRIVIAQRVEKDNPSESSSLVFLRREGKLYLFQLWYLGAMNGTQIPSANENESAEQERKFFTLVIPKPKVN